jgi:hypothetical protein
MPVVMPSLASMETVKPVHGHLRYVEPVNELLGHRQADEAPPMGRHEVYVVGRHELGGHREVALVLPILVVTDDYHLAGLDVL